MGSWDVFIAFSLTLFAGLATGVGSALAFYAKRTNTTVLSLSLGFSAGVMIYVSFIEIFPKAKDALVAELGEVHGCWATVGAFFIGMIFIAVIDKLVPDFENPHEVHTSPAGVSPFPATAPRPSRLFTRKAPDLFVWSMASTAATFSWWARVSGRNSQIEPAAGSLSSSTAAAWVLTRFQVPSTSSMCSVFLLSRWGVTCCIPTRPPVSVRSYTWPSSPEPPPGGPGPGSRPSIGDGKNAVRPPGGPCFCHFERFWRDNSADKLFHLKIILQPPLNFPVHPPTILVS